MKTNLQSYEKARQKIHTGVNKLADVVTITLGAKGRNVAIAHTDYKGEIYKRDIIHDGVKVARAIHLKDEDENMGASVLKEAAEKTVMEVGDGTTVTILLAQAIFNEAYKAISTGSDPVAIREGLEQARTLLTNKLSEYSLPVKNLTQSKHIAYISCQEETIGDMIAETIEKIGVDGIIRIEEGKNNKTEVEFQTGMQFDKGYAHEYFITNLEKNEAIVELPYILITDKPITTLEPLSKLLQELHTRHASLVIIAPSFSTEALSVLLQNKLSGALSNLAINAPSFGENQREILEDIAILTGATFISDAAGYKFEDLTTKQLGKCDYITSSDKSTLIVGGKADVTERVAAIKHKLEEEEDDFKSEKLKERLAKLTNGIAVIHVGGYTEIEMKERKERIDDAVHATQAAMKKGIIAGGETIYLLLREELGNSLPETLLYKALEKPFNKLVENAGFDSGVMRERWANSLLKNKGVDVRDGKVKDMVKTGIIDPLLVVSSALYNSISVAISLLLTEAIITPERQVK